MIDFVLVLRYDNATVLQRVQQGIVFLNSNGRHVDRVEYVIDGTMMLAGPDTELALSDRQAAGKPTRHEASKCV
jgi:hypothetical protein